MLENFRTYALKATALMGVFSFIYPAIAAARTLIFKNDGGTGCILFALILVAAGFAAASAVISEKSSFFRRLAAGPVAEFIFDKHATAQFLSDLAVHIAALAPVIITVMLFQKDGISRAVFEAVPALIFYMVGVRAHYGNFDDILNRQKMYAGIAFIAVSTAVCSFMDVELNFIIYAYILMVTSMIVANQTKIDHIFLHMNRRLAGVSKDIRRFNMLSVFLLFGVTLLFLNLRDIVAFCLNAMNNIIRTGIVLFLRLLDALLSPVPEAGREEPAQPPLPFNLDDEGSPSPYIDLIFKIIFAIILLYAVYKVLPVIFRAVKGILLRVWLYILSILKKTDAEVPEEDDYNDEVEEIRPDKAPAKGRKKPAARLKRNIRGLKRITNPVERIRYLYGMILDALVVENIGIQKSDTPGDICNKAKIKDFQIKEITEAYEKVRYGDIVPDADEAARAEECCTKALQRFFK